MTFQGRHLWHYPHMQRSGRYSQNPHFFTGLPPLILFPPNWNNISSKQFFPKETYSSNVLLQFLIDFSLFIWEPNTQEQSLGKYCCVCVHVFLCAHVCIYVSACLSMYVPVFVSDCLFPHCLFPYLHVLLPSYWTTHMSSLDIACLCQLLGSATGLSHNVA